VSKVLEEVVQTNRRYAAGVAKKPKLAISPARRLAILTCMDARLDPAKFAGLELGDAHVIRNAGGRASDDAIRSLVISHKLLGTREWLVIHHTECGMQSFTNEIMRELLAESLDTASYVDGVWKNTGTGPGSRAGDSIDWLTFKDQKQGVIDDVERIRTHPLVPRNIAIYGFVYDVATGLLNEVAEASRRGAASSMAT
jgi:carbonic anhydrase